LLPGTSVLIDFWEDRPYFGKQLRGRQGIILTINDLYTEARGGGQVAVDNLFGALTESFRIFVQQRIWNPEDGREIVQDSLTAIAAKYKEIDFEISFAAWAYKVLENKILHYYRTKRCRESKFAQTDNEQDRAASPEFNPDLQRRLLGCLKKISAVNRRHARILNYCYQGFTTEEICERLEVTRNNVYILLSRARSMLKLCLEKGDIL
jgi:RNA polymerase sigma factor (sigma-70 family)